MTEAQNRRLMLFTGNTQDIKGQHLYGKTR